MNGVSVEWVEAREDEIAVLITAGEHVDKLRTLAHVLRKRNMVSAAYYHDLCDSLDYIAAALLTGKRNTSILRNGGNK